MAEQKNNMTDRQLAEELQKGKRGGLGGRLLEILGVVVVAAGAVFGGSVPAIIAGALLAGIGEWLRRKSTGKADRLTMDTLAPGVVGAVMENVEMPPSSPLLHRGDTNIPVPSHDYCSESGRIRGVYQGLTTELCTVRLTDVSEFQREETNQWERNEREVYAGQWALCRLEREFPTWLTIWPRERLEKLLNARTIKAENEDFNKRFNLSSGDAQEALRILNPSRMERLMALAETSGRFALNLNTDGKLYIAVHSGHGFFEAGKGRETPEQLRQRFARELKLFTDIIDVFRPV